MFIGGLLLVVAVYAIVSLISFFAVGTDDQSLTHSLDFEQMMNRSESVKNAGGPLGARLADLLISGSFGIGSIAIVIYVALLGLSLVGLRKVNFLSLTFKTLITVIAVSIVLGMVTFNFATPFYWGGIHGMRINQWLYNVTGVWGMLGVSVVMMSALVFLFLKQISDSFGWCKHRVAQWRENVRERKLQRREYARRQRNQREEDGHSADSSQQAASAVAAETQPAAESVAKPKPQQPLVEPVTEIADEEVIEESEERDDARGNVANPPMIDIDSEDCTPPDEDSYNASYAGEEDEPFVSETVGVADEEVPTAEGPELITTVAAEIEEAEDTQTELYDPTAELRRYLKPGIELLNDRPVKECSVDEAEQEENKARITRVLNNFGIDILRIEATVGPTITLYEIVPAEGVRINKIRNLEDDIALSLSAKGIRIIAPMPGKGTIGIEVPNKDAQIVSIRSILSSRAFQESKAELPMAMGATISNEVYIADLTRMPHLLVAGSTGMGKSVGLNTILASILYKKHPAEVKFVLVDPKMVEFSLYSCIERHYLAKLPLEDEAIITDTSKVVPTLNSLCKEMDDRYELLKKANVRSIKEYNGKFIAKRLNPEKGHRYLPYIVVVIDEFADLLMTAGKEVENPIARIAQKARAVGIHLILATQRPSANIITGVIRANFPGRIAFRVTQQMESRIILDRSGAQQLIGRGDMLFSRDGEIERVQCAFIDTDEVERICKWISDQPGYEDAYMLPEYTPADEGGGGASMSGGSNMTDRDPLFEAAARHIIQSGIASTTSVQRHFSIGFPRAGKIMDQLEKAGIVGPTVGAKPRAILMDSVDLDRFLEVCGGNL
ncbi:MAG: DNA translocase FtsK [Paramuribaculum sp.]|nr:DNA translocase FtsK [Paramuribaculum sp.]